MASYPNQDGELAMLSSHDGEAEGTVDVVLEREESADDEGHRTQRVLSHGLGECEDEGHEHECGYECAEGGYWGGRTALKERVRTGKAEYWDVVTHLNLTKSVPLWVSRNHASRARPLQVCG